MQFTPGSYWAELVGGIVGAARTGNPQMVLTFNVTHRAVNGQWEGIEPTQRRVFLSMSGGAIPYTREKLARLGFNDDMRTPDFAMTEGVEIVMRVDTYEGKQNEKWELAGGGPGEVQPAPEDVLRKLQAQWNAGGVQRPTPAAAKPAPRPVARPAPQAAMATDDGPPAADPATGEDIPF